ncbi:MAG: glycoside hydrolase family 95 protein [Verrucomicrobia bacterium]|nr:glycoside hydrolase family 95 protein [Verrucomicrobiota bacterium]
MRLHKVAPSQFLSLTGLGRQCLFLVLMAGMLQIAGADPNPPPAGALTLWYRQPAQRWLEALPVGNGRLGAMVFGGVKEERLALNESTFWSGKPSASHENPSGRGHLAAIRSLLLQRKFGEAQPLIQEHLLGRPENYGTHLPVGDLLLEVRHPEGEVTDYRRELGLEDATARVTYSVGTVHYRREVFASHPDSVIVVRLEADRPGSVSCRMGFHPNREPSRVRTEGPETLVVEADARERRHSDGQCGVSLAGRIRVVAESGSVRNTGDAVEVSGADAATIVVALNTTLLPGDPAARSERQVASATRRTAAALHRRHQDEHQTLFRRVTLDLGRSAADALATDERLTRLRAGGLDPGLDALFFQYGRYLLIAGSREDSPLPTNLQGLWNDNLACNMGWTCDFHLDINTQQNYWPAEVGNLPECHEPLFRLIEALRVPGRRTAQAVYGARGWVCHVFTNPWGFTAPGWSLGWGMHPTGGIWIASHLWEHYRFSGDREFLRERAYPTLKEAAEFFLDTLVEDPVTGWRVTGPSTSPENTFLIPGGQGRCSESMGPTCDIVLVRDVFVSCIEASRQLDTDAGFRRQLEDAVVRLPPLRVGRHGQLMEWLEDYEEAEPNHRHTTHLIALHPGGQIQPRVTPELAAAARRTIERRVGRADWEDVEWSRGNLINYFARLGDGEEAHRQLQGLLKAATDADLLTYSRSGVAGAADNIFCVDGNSAGAAGIAEMLLQSHGDGVELLPALPSAWPAGRVTGLRARGNLTVDLEWSHGRLLTYRLRSPGPPRSVPVRVQGTTLQTRTTPLH